MSTCGSRTSITAHLAGGIGFLFSDNAIPRVHIRACRLVPIVTPPFANYVGLTKNFVLHASRLNSRQ